MLDGYLEVSSNLSYAIMLSFGLKKIVSNSFFYTFVGYIILMLFIDKYGFVIEQTSRVNILLNQETKPN